MFFSIWEFTGSFFNNINEKEIATLILMLNIKTDTHFLIYFRKKI